MSVGQSRVGSSQRLLLWWALAVYSLLVLPRLLSTGMFVDGLTYASLARNMSEGYGSFWRPAYTATVYPVFTEHPPLAFWLQSWAFWLCGDTPVVEAMWGGGLGFLMALTLAGIWRCLTPAEGPRAGAWWPVGLWVVMPLTSWTVANNMLENTLTVCVLGAVWLCLHGVQHPHVGVAWGYQVGAAVCLVAGVLVKGPVALFPLVVPACFLLYDTRQQRRTLVLGGVFFGASVLLLGGLLLTTPAAREFVWHYGQRQLLASLSGAREMAGARWEVLHAVSREVAVPLLLGALGACLPPGRGVCPPRRAADCCATSAWPWPGASPSW